MKGDFLCQVVSILKRTIKNYLLNYYIESINFSSRVNRKFSLLKIKDDRTTFLKKDKQIKSKFLNFSLIILAFVCSKNINAKSISIKEDVLKSNVFIEKSVRNSEQLLDAIENNRDVFHLFSHGKSGELLINGKWLNAHEVVQWIRTIIDANSLKQLNIYGCEFGKGIKGVKAVDILVKELGIKIAASNDLTGRGGDWNLEVGETSSSISLPTYKYTLQIPSSCRQGVDSDGDGISDNCDLDDDNDGILDTVEESLTTTTTVASPVIFRDRFNGYGTNAIGNDIVAPGWNGVYTPDLLTSNGLTYRSPDGGTVAGLLHVPNFQLCYWFFFSYICDPVINWREEINRNVSGLQRGEDYYIVMDISPTQNGDTGSSGRVAVNFGGTTRYSQTIFSSSNHPRNGRFEKTVIGPFRANSSSQTIKLTATSNQDRLSNSHHNYSVGTYMLIDDLKIYKGHPDGTTVTVVNRDFDNDGIPNRLDVDSDNDGCPDALESSGNPYKNHDLNTNGSLSLAVNTNSNSSTFGVPNSRSYGKGTAYNTRSSSSKCNSCTPGNSGYIDSDGDRIADNCDLDDDNDGILDTDEDSVTTTHVPSEVIFRDRFNGYGTNNIGNTIVAPGWNGVYTPDLLNSRALTYPSQDGGTVAGLLHVPNFQLCYWVFFSYICDPLVNWREEIFRTIYGLERGKEYYIEMDISPTQDNVTGSSGRVAVNFGGTTRYTKKIYNRGFHPRNGPFQKVVVGPFRANGSSQSIRLSATSYQDRLSNSHHKFSTGTYILIDDLRIYKGHPNGTTVTVVNRDFDNDGIPNRLDLDSDNDGCPDALESAGNPYNYSDLDSDTRLSGVVDRNDRSATYGVPNSNNYSIGISQDANRQAVVCDSCSPGNIYYVDSDGDGIGDDCDLDDDNDGILDTVENGGNSNRDTDGDGIVDRLDLDSDNDGCPDALESAGNNYDFNDLNSNNSLLGGVNTNSSSATYGVPNGVSFSIGTSRNASQLAVVCDTCNSGNSNFVDSDGDGIGNDCDLDDDNDGILDTVENGGNSNRDTDGDGIIDRIDLDSDNDGIYDITEAGTDSLDSNNDGRVDDMNTPGSGADADSDGLADVVETINGNNNGTNPRRTTSGVFDYLNADSDGDGCSDANEAYNDPETDGTGDTYYNPLNLAEPLTQVAGAVSISGKVVAAPYNTGDVQRVIDANENACIPPNTTNAVNDFITINVNATHAVGNVLTNDFDIEGDNQTVSSGPIEDVSHGRLWLLSNGVYIYIPNPDFVGEDSFTYQVCDDNSAQACSTAKVFIEVLPDASNENKAPIANPDNGMTLVNTVLSGNLIVNDFDPDGDSITIDRTPVSNVNNGSLVINADGTYVYTPNADFIGEDSFVYKICDSASPTPMCDTAVVNIQVLPNNGNITVANDDAYFIVNTGTNSLNANVLDNDTDPEGHFQFLKINSSSPNPIVDVSNGTLSLNGDGRFQYKPNEGFIGRDSFVYEVCDAGNPQACDRATVHIIVSERSRPPTPPDFSPVLFTAKTIVNGSKGRIDFVIAVAESNLQDADGINPVEVRISGSNNFDFTFENSLTTLNGMTVNNADWSYVLEGGLHKFTFVGNGGVFPGNTLSKIGVKALFISPANSRGQRPLKVTIKSDSGGQTNTNNDNDEDIIHYSNSSN